MSPCVWSTTLQRTSRGARLSQEPWESLSSSCPGLRFKSTRLHDILSLPQYENTVSIALFYLHAFRTIDISWGHCVIWCCISTLNHLLHSSTLLRCLATPSIWGLFSLSPPPSFSMAETNLGFRSSTSELLTDTFFTVYNCWPSLCLMLMTNYAFKDPHFQPHHWSKQIASNRKTQIWAFTTIRLSILIYS